MSLSRTSALGLAPSHRAKLALVGVAFAATTLALAYDAHRHHSGKADMDRFVEAQLERQPDRIAERTRAGLNYYHKADLDRLLEATEPLPESRCEGFHRRRLRDALDHYVDGRVNAQRAVARNPALADALAIYQTPADDQALSQASDLMQQGYLLASDLASWTPAEDAVFALPHNVASACALPRAEAEKAASR